jgi:hypothetical protein
MSFGMINGWLQKTTCGRKSIPLLYDPQVPHITWHVIHAATQHAQTLNTHFTLAYPID